MNRRELLQSFAALWALQSCRPVGPLFSTEKIASERWFYSGLELPSTSAGKPAFGIAGTWGSETQVFNVENVIHSIAFHPEKGIKVFLPKTGSLAYYQTGNENLRSFGPDSGNYFYGHGAFDLKRNVFYTTQSDVSKSGPNEERRFSKGYIYVHSLPDFKIIRKFPSFGNDPHDLKIVGDEIVVCNGGHKSNISFIDPDTETLKQSYFLNDELLSAGHLEVLDESNFVVVTGSYRQLYPCGIYSLNRKEGIRKFAFPPGLDVLFRVQLLSVIHHENHIYATCPHTDSLFIWNNSGTFIGAHHVPMATSLAASTELGGVIVGSGLANQPLRLFSMVNGNLRTKTLDWGTRSTGSHSLVI